MAVSAINRNLLVRQTDVGQAVAVDVGALGLGGGGSTHYIKWDDTSTGGEVTLETADDPTYTGTWAPVKVFPWSGANRQDAFNVIGPYVALRHRISLSIVGGTVTTRIVGSN